MSSETDDRPIVWHDENKNWRSRETGDQAAADRDEALKIAKDKQAQDKATADEQARKEQEEAKRAAENEDVRERVVAAGAGARKNSDGSTTILNAAGGELGSIGADGSFTHNPDETTTQGMYRDADGKLHWDNGKLAGPAPKPNAPPPSDKGTVAPESVVKQRQMEAATENLLKRLRQNNPDGKSDETLLTEYAMRHNAKLPRPVDKTNVGPKVAIFGGGDPHQRFLERQRNFVKNNPNAVSPQERANVLGGFASGAAEAGGTPTGAGAAEAERVKRVSQANQEFEAAKQREKESNEKKKKAMAYRRIALGNAAGVLLGGLRDAVEAAKKDPKLVSVSKTGQRWIYRKLGGDNLDALNQKWKANGGGSEFKDVFVRIEVDSNGDVMKGASPQLITRDSRSGQTGDGELGMKIWSLDRVETAVRDAYKTDGMTEDVANAQTYNLMAGFGVIGKAAEEERLRKEGERKLKEEAAKQAMDIANREMANKEGELWLKKQELRLRVIKEKIEQNKGYQLNGDDVNVVTGMIANSQERLSELEGKFKGNEITEGEYNKERDRIVGEIEKWKGLLYGKYFKGSAAGAGAGAGNGAGVGTSNPNADDAKKNAADAKVVKAGRKGNGAGGAAAAGETPTGGAQTGTSAVDNTQTGAEKVGATADGGGAEDNKNVEGEKNPDAQNVSVSGGRMEEAEGRGFDAAAAGDTPTGAGAGIEKKIATVADDVKNKVSYNDDEESARNGTDVIEDVISKARSIAKTAYGDENSSHVITLIRSILKNNGIVDETIIKEAEKRLENKRKEENKKIAQQEKERAERMKRVGAYDFTHQIFKDAIKNPNNPKQPPEIGKHPVTKEQADRKRKAAAFKKNQGAENERKIQEAFDALRGTSLPKVGSK